MTNPTSRADRYLLGRKTETAIFADDPILAARRTVTSWEEQNGSSQHHRRLTVPIEPSHIFLEGKTGTAIIADKLFLLGQTDIFLGGKPETAIIADEPYLIEQTSR